MAVTPADLKSPTGKIDGASFFPGEIAVTLDARLQAYIDEGETEAGNVADWPTPAEYDAAVALWAYFRAFEAVYLRLIATPSSVTIEDEGSTRFSREQIAAFGAKADGFKVAFLGAVETALGSDETPASPTPMGAVATKVTW